MAALSDTQDNKDYGLYKEAKAIFKSSIEAIMKGDVDTFMGICSSFLQENVHVEATEFFREFKSEGKTLIHMAASSGRICEA